MSKRHRGFIEDFRPRAATSDLIERAKEVLRLFRQIFYRLVGARTTDGSVGYDKTELA
jgi:hypothetical protein